MPSTDTADARTGTDIRINETYDGQPAGRGRARSPHAARLSVRGATSDDAARPRPDPYIWGIYLLLLVISVIELYSASSSEVTASNVYGPLIRHVIFIGAGFGMVVAMQNMHYSVFRRSALFFAVLSLGLLLVSNLFGININGAQRAISVAGFTIQPAEIAKLTVVVYVAAILARYQMPGGVRNTGVVKAGLVVIIFGGLLYANGFTNMMLLMLTSLCLFLIGGMQLRKIVILLVVYAVCGAAMYGMKATLKAQDEFDRAHTATTEVVVESPATVSDRTGTRVNRITRFLEGVHPHDTITDENRQVMLAKFAQANGGVFGRGPGNSRESSRLPLAFSDYIYSIVIEETGFLGGCLLLALYLFLLARAGRIANRCNKAFPALLIMGCAVLIVFQALVHMAIVTGVFPVSGQPLPLISKGGTSILVMSAAIGMMLSVSRSANSRVRATRRKGTPHPEEAEADNPTQLSAAG